MLNYSLHRPTVTDAYQFGKRIGAVILWKYLEQEFHVYVRVPGETIAQRRERTYHTPDMDDAIGTACAMVGYWEN